MRPRHRPCRGARQCCAVLRGTQRRDLHGGTAEEPGRGGCPGTLQEEVAWQKWGKTGK